MNLLRLLLFVFYFGVSLFVYAAPPEGTFNSDKFHEFDTHEKQDLKKVEQLLLNSDISFDELKKLHPELVARLNIKKEVNTSIRDNVSLSGIPTFARGMFYGPYGVAITAIDSETDETIRNVVIAVGVVAIIVGGVIIINNNNCCSGGNCGNPLDQACNSLFNDACSGLGNSCSSSLSGCSTGCSSGSGACSSSGGGC